MYLATPLVVSLFTSLFILLFTLLLCRGMAEYADISHVQDSSSNPFVFEVLTGYRSKVRATNGSPNS